MKKELYKLDLKELKKNYDYGDRSLLDYLGQFIEVDDQLYDLYVKVCEFNEIYANDWTISKLLKMGKEDKYWIARAHNFINKYDIKENEFDEHTIFFNQYKDLRDELLIDLGIDTNVLEMNVDDVPSKWFVESEIITKLNDLNDKGSFTVARVMNFCHCVELHYSSGKAMIEYATKTEPGCWDIEYEEVNWFDKNINEEELVEKLEKKFKDYFGEHEFVLEGEENEICSML